MHIVVITKAVKLENGETSLIQTPFENLPDWAKDLVRPRWDHPTGCECGACWEEAEGR